jgi:hypothetical protein
VPPAITGPPGPDVHPPDGARARSLPATTTILATGVLAALALAVPAQAAPPAPCGGTPQITDARGDGHHANTDVTAAWLSEDAGRLQAVVQVAQGVWAPAHDDSDAAGFALLFRIGGADPIRYVRAEALRDGTLRYDHGTWTSAGGFASQGATTGSATSGPDGAVTIDFPAATGAVAGARVTGPFALTYDGITGAAAHWVDRAPGGTSPDTTETGADVLVGSCTPGAPGPGGDPGTPGGTAGPPATAAVALTAPSRITGERTVKLTGKATPGRAGVPVAVTVTPTRGRARTVTTTTRATGAWALRVRLAETSTVRAVVEGVGSQTRTVTVRARVRITTVTRRSGRRVVVRGTVSPRLPGRVLLLPADDVRPVATARPATGRFTLRLRRPPRGRYQAVFLPSGERAERATSNTRTIR